jgi:hypothetical protein
MNRRGRNSRLPPGTGKTAPAMGFAIASCINTFHFFSCCQTVGGLAVPGVVIGSWFEFRSAEAVLGPPFPSWLTLWMILGRWLGARRERPSRPRHPRPWRPAGNQSEGVQRQNMPCPSPSGVRNLASTMERMNSGKVPPGASDRIAGSIYKIPGETRIRRDTA